MKTFAATPDLRWAVTISTQRQLAGKTVTPFSTAEALDSPMPHYGCLFVVCRWYAFILVAPVRGGAGCFEWLLHHDDDNSYAYTSPTSGRPMREFIETILRRKTPRKVTNPRSPQRLRAGHDLVLPGCMPNIYKERLYHWYSWSVASENRDSRPCFITQAVTTFRPSFDIWTRN